jgi:hypothetical protein
MSETVRSSLNTIAGAVCDLMGVAPPNFAAAGNTQIKEYAENIFGGAKADRVLMYHPDAVPQWLVEKYPVLMEKVANHTDLALPFLSPMMPVTPVCFATIYTGTMPDIHGIKVYERPVLRADTIFDTLLRAGKKPAVVAHKTCTFAKLFVEREMDYYFYSTIEEMRAKVAELILEDRYDLISVHDWIYDSVMHRCGPESIAALCEAKGCSDTYAMLDSLVREHWQHHNVLCAFATDHGCHEIEGSKGDHHDDIPEDRHILHYYQAYAAKK